MSVLHVANASRIAPLRVDRGDLFSYDARSFEGVETKGFSQVDEEALIAWQDVLDMVAAGRPSEVGCPFCNHRPLTVEEVEHSTRISCPKCKKFIQGRFQP
jgi:hypothetical protein